MKRATIVLFLFALLLSACRVAPEAKVSTAPGWADPVDLAHPAYGVYVPELTLDSQGYAHAVYYGDAADASAWGVWYTNNRAGFWSLPLQIASGGSLRLAKIVAGSGGILHVVYENHTVGQIYYLYSTDFGATWSAPQNISQSPRKAYEPALAVDAAGNVHAVWIDSRWSEGALYQATYATRTGGAWGAAVRIQRAVRFTKEPHIAVQGATVHVTFYGKPLDTSPNSDYEVYYLAATGGVWGALINLSNSPGRASYTPDIACSPTGVHVAWDESPPGSYHDIYLANSPDGGATWGAPIPVTSSPDLDRFPALAWGADRVHLVYDSDPAGLLAFWIVVGGNAMYATYDPATGILAPPLQLASTAGASQHAAVVASEAGYKGVAWQDKTPGLWTVLYTYAPFNAPPPTPTPRPTVAPTVTPPCVPCPTCRPGATVAPEGEP